MNSLKDIAKRSILRKEVTDDVQMLKERLFELGEEVQEQKLMIMELEENQGAVAQENEWLWEEVQKLKIQIADLENIIFGQQVR